MINPTVKFADGYLAFESLGSNANPGEVVRDFMERLWFKLGTNNCNTRIRLDKIRNAFYFMVWANTETFFAVQYSPTSAYSFESKDEAEKYAESIGAIVIETYKFIEPYHQFKKSELLEN